MSLSTSSTITPSTPSPHWSDDFNLDVLLSTLFSSLFHPFPAWLISLTLASTNTPLSSTRFTFSILYAFVISFIHFIYPRDPPLTTLLKNRTNFPPIVITGGSSGLGLCLVQLFAQHGFPVAIIDKNPPPAESLSIKSIAYFPCDIHNSSTLQSTVTLIRQKLGHPAVLINNAAVITAKPLANTTIEQISQSIGTNLLAPFYLINLFMPDILSHGFGSIVNISSVLAYTGCANLSDYTAAKAGLIALNSSLAAELSNSLDPNARNIHLILCIPGQLATPLFAHVTPKFRFIAPVLSPQVLALRIFTKVLLSLPSNPSSSTTSPRYTPMTLIRAPFYAHFIPFITLLPSSFQEFLRKLAHIDHSMIQASSPPPSTQN